MSDELLVLMGEDYKFFCEFVCKICEKFLGEYWCEFDEKFEYFFEFVQVLIEYEYFGVLIFEEYGGLGLLL